MLPVIEREARKCIGPASALRRVQLAHALTLIECDDLLEPLALAKILAKVVEDEKQYQRDKLRMYQMHRTYMEEAGASVGATVMSPVRVPRR